MIQNPKVLSGATRTRDNWCQKWYGSFELLDLKLVKAAFYKHGDTTDVRTPVAGQAKAEAEMKADKEETKANQVRIEESLKGDMRLTVSAIEG
jgi:hypothetical protein